MEIRRFKFVTGVSPPETESSGQNQKRQKLEGYNAAHSFSRDCENAVESSASDEEKEKQLVVVENGNSEYPKYGVASVCGRRRDMEDAVAIHPSFLNQDHETTTKLHYFGVYDGHGCSHVATKCRERLHEVVKEELLERQEEEDEEYWKSAMERSFFRMDKEVITWNDVVLGAKCRCELQSPECDTVGSTAVVAIVTPDKIIVANCGDSRAVLCRNGKPLPLSSDHK